MKNKFWISLLVVALFLSPAAEKEARTSRH